MSSNYSPLFGFLTGVLRMPVWLSRQANSRLDSQSLFSRASGVGLVARLWAVDQKAICFDMNPTDRAIAWARSLSESDLHVLLCIFAHRVADLADHTSLEMSGATIVENRDDIESVFWVLSRTAEKENAKAILGGLDEGFSADMVKGLVFSPELTDRLYAVSGFEPYNWWLPC